MNPLPNDDSDQGREEQNPVTSNAAQPDALVPQSDASSRSNSIDEFPAFAPETADEEGDLQHKVAPIPSVNDALGTMIGPYKLLQVIGRGGMGVVYMAEQRHPMRRRVALKVIKADADSSQFLARFAAERQALAMMDHPNIAKALDAGEDDGRPYFAMDYVQGIPLTEYCDQNKHTIEQRLKLFRDVCRAVQHAHQKGVIHRDLKPSNILVEEIDAIPAPKVIDFGLAKALNAQARLTEETFFTEFGRIVGTVQYMSPEQAKLSQLDVDTRTDVYSLGVILYELLTGRRPLDDDTIKQKALLEVLEMIREEEPSKPSSRLSDHDETSVEASKRRRVSRSRLEQLIRGDLDWVVLKALEKDRSRRYDGAGGLADDIQNYLDGNPVMARKPTLTYRFSKYLRKYWAAAVASALVFLTLLAGVVSTAWFAYRLNDRNLELQSANEQLVAQSKENETQRRELETQQTEISKKNQKLTAANTDLKNAQLDLNALPLRTNSRLLANTYTFGVSQLNQHKIDALRKRDRGTHSSNHLTVARQTPRRVWLGRVCVSGSGEYVATGDYLSGQIRIWNTKTLELETAWDAHRVPAQRGGYWPTISSLAFHPFDEDVLVSSGLDGAIRKWSWRTNDLLVEATPIEGQQITASVLQTKAAKVVVVAGTNEGYLVSLDAQDLTKIREARPEESRLNAVAVAQTGKIALGTESGEVHIISQEFTVAHTLPLDGGSVLCAGFAPSGSLVACGDSQGQVHVIDTSNGELQRSFEAHGPEPLARDDQRRVRCLTWHQGLGIVTSGSDAMLRTWNRDTFKEDRVFVGHKTNAFGRSDVSWFALDAGGSTLVSVGRDHTLRGWDAKSRKELWTLEGPVYPHEVFHTSDYVRFDLNAKHGQLLVATDSKDAYARLWDVSELRETSSYSQFPIDDFIDEWDGPLTQDVALAPDGEHFAVAEPTGQISFWRVGANQPEKVVDAHGEPHFFIINPRHPRIILEWAVESSRLLSIGQDYRLKVWDGKTHELLKSLDLDDADIPLSNYDMIESEVQRELARLEHQLSYYDSQLLSLEHHVVTAGRDRRLRFWNLETGQIEHRINVGSQVTCLARSEDGKLIAAGTETGQVAIIEVAKHEMLAMYSLNFYATDQFAFDSEPTMNITSWMGDQLTREWNQKIVGLSFSPNSRLLAVTSGNGALCLVTTSGDVIDRSFCYDNFARSMRQQYPVFLIDGSLLTVGADYAIRQWDLFHFPAKEISPSPAAVTGLVQDTQSNRWLKLEADGSCIVYEGHDQIASLPDDLGQITSVAFIPNSRHLLLGTLNGRGIRYDYESQSVVLEFRGQDGDRQFDKPVGARGRGSTVACSYNGRIAASIWSDEESHWIELWNLDSGKLLDRIESEDGSVSLAFHPADQMLAYGERTGKVHAIDFRSGIVELFQASGPRSSTGLAFSPDGTLLAQTGDLDNGRVISLWKTESGSEVDPRSGDSMPSLEISRQQRALNDASPFVDEFGKLTICHPDVCFSPDGAWMAVAGLDGFLYLYRVAEDNRMDLCCKLPVRRLEHLIGDLDEVDAHKNPSTRHGGVQHVEFSHDGMTIKFAGYSGPVFEVAVEEIVAFSERTAEQRLEDLQRSTGLQLRSDGSAITTQRNHLVPSNQAVDSASSP